MPFAPIQTEKVASAVRRQMEKLILQGVLRPGERLPAERDLAQKLNVSRPTVREALAELEERDLIAIRPGGGAYVSEVLSSAFSPSLIELFATQEDAVYDYIEFRRDLEGLAAARAAERATASDREVISSIYNRMLEAHGAGDLASEAELDADFHMSIVEAAHNVVMLHMARSLYQLLRRGVFYNRNVVYGETGSREKLLTQHTAIHDAVVAGDAAGATKAVQAHMDFIKLHLASVNRARGREEIADLRRDQEARLTQRDWRRKRGGEESG